MSKVIKTDQQWQEQLTPEQYQVLRQKATEPAFSGKLYHNQAEGMYSCVACGQELFNSETKFDSGSGWPSFSNPANLAHVELKPDTSHGMERTEVTCKQCGGHLGHLFDDGPITAGGNRYCINSCALSFKETTKNE